MDPDLRNFTISMPLVGAFVIGSAICCCICHRRSIKRRIKRFRSTKQVLKPRSIGITYVESLEYDKQLLEKALAKVTKLRDREPDRQDLRRLAKGLRKDMKMIDQYLSNYTHYATQSFQITDQGFDQILAARKNSINMPGGSLVNPIFNPLESGRRVSYIFDPLKVDAAKYVGEIQPQNVEPNDLNLQSFPKSLEMLPQSQAGEKYGSFILNPMLIPTTPLSPFSSSSGYDSEIEFASQRMEASTSKSQVSPSHDNSHEMQPSTSKSPIKPNMQHMINTQYSQPSTSRSHVQQEIQRLDIPTTSMSHVQQEIPQEIQRLDIPTTSFQPSTSESFTKPNSREIEAQARAASISMYSTDFNGPYSSLNNITCAMCNDCPKYLRQSKLSAQSKYLQEKVGNLPLNLVNKTTPILQSAPSTPKGLPVIKLGNKRGLSIIIADPEGIGTP